MTWRRHPYACLSACLLLMALAAPAGAAAKQKPITGKLNARGYTVIAMSSTGAVTAYKAVNGKFRLRPPAATVTLQLRKPDGSYGGPVVIGSAKRGRRAIVGVKAGAKLAGIKVKRTRGYAIVARTVSKRWVASSRWARARKGIPIGAGNFGHTRSKPPSHSPSGDLDADGVPNRFDVDTNGNLILNNVDRTTASGARAAQTTSQFVINSQLEMTLPNTVNANATAVTDADIDAGLSKNLTLAIEVTPGSAELDCGGAADPNNPNGWIGGLSYCTRGGSGKVLLGPPGSEWQPYPACCDDDGDGLGTLPNNSPNHVPDPGWFYFKPAATTSQIGTGDVLIQRITSGGATSDVATMMPFTFATVPALASYTDGQGNSATVQYPVPPIPGLGTESDPYPVAAGPNGHVMMDIKLWRPQRRPIPPETGQWTDIGRLGYAVQFQRLGAQDVSLVNTSCPQSAFAVNDSNLIVRAVPQLVQDAGGVGDLAVDQPADPAHTINFTLDLTACLAARGLTWNTGEAAFINLGAYDNGAGSSATVTGTSVVFKLQ